MAADTSTGRKRDREGASAASDTWSAKRSRTAGDMALEVSVVRFAESRALELEALSQAVERVGGTKLAFQRLPRHMRRRAMSHNIRRVPRRLRQKVQAEIEKRDKKGVNKRPSRRHRRRPSSLLSEYQRRQRHNAWLETHIWHAKRFKMTTAWGYRLPVHPSDKSLRACYRATTQHCLLQDISYECCIELSGPRVAILEALEHVTSKATGLTFAAKATSSGQRWGEVMLYTCHSYPLGALSPVLYLWRAPGHVINPSVESNKEKLWLWCHPAAYSRVWTELVRSCSLVAGVDVGSGDAVVQFSGASVDYHSVMSEKPEHDPQRSGTIVSVSMEKNVTASGKTSKLSVTLDEDGKASRKIAVRHSKRCKQTSAAPGEAESATRQPLPPGGTEVRVGNIQLVSLKDQLVRFRLTGPASNLVLSETLRQVNVSPEASSTGENKMNGTGEATEGKLTGHAGEGKPMQMDAGGGTSAQAAGSEGGEVKLQRWWQRYYTDSDTLCELRSQQCVWERFAKCRSPAEVPPRAVLALTVRDPRLLLPPKRSKVDLNDAVSSSDAITWEQLPQSASVSPLLDKAVRQDVSTSKMSEQELNKRRSQLLLPGSALQLGDLESRVPILLLQRPGAQQISNTSASGRPSPPVCVGMGSGWDLVLPNRWGMAFWVALVYRGARVGGLREARSVAARSGELHFPYDFPDTAAGEQQQLETKQQLMDKHARRPPAKRCNYPHLGVPVPFLSPFARLVKEWNAKAAELMNSSMQDKYAAGGKSLLTGPLVNAATSAVDTSVPTENPTAVSITKDTTLVVPSTSVSQDNQTHTGFYVLRCRRLLRNLSDIVLASQHEASAMLHRFRRVHGNRKLSHNGDTKLSILLSRGQNQALVSAHLSSIVAVTVTCLLCGIPAEHAMICLPTHDDLEQLDKDLDFGGPVERLHPQQCSPADKLKKKTKKKKKANKDDKAGFSTAHELTASATSQMQGKSVGEVNQTVPSSPTAIDSVQKPALSTAKVQPSGEQLSDKNEPEVTLIDATDRTIIGFLTNGSFDFGRGQGSGLGFCALLGLLGALRNTPDGKPCHVLLRNPTSRQYRFARLSVLV